MSTFPRNVRELIVMKLHEMTAVCRMCGKELKADTKDDDFVTFYCMKCGVYTTKPLDEFREPPPAPEAVAEAVPLPKDSDQ